MPGIHVRTLGKLHWEDQDKEPVLTVPGSYWLCHKNNIYKFTFKFHRTIRNSEDFSYSKELMKIIRRVIKWQPKEGQHFSTKNLLVTYNHASWTRQDKMFAVMKFYDRPDAIAFPHAFILTVKVLHSEQQQSTEEAMGASMSKSDAENPTADRLALDDLSTDCLTSDNSPKDKEEFESVVSLNGHLDKDVSWSLRTRSRLKDVDNCTSTNLITNHSMIRDQSENSTAETNNEKHGDADSSCNFKDMDCDWQCDPNEELKMASQQNNFVDHDEDSNSSISAQSDTASLPYQYLIEKDIERELENSRNAKLNLLEENNKTSVNLIENVCDSSFNNDDDDNDSKSSKDSQKSYKSKSRQESRDDSMPPPDVANLRSSDITDLVMKGLMFTIRQDKDTVTVMEQKTKLEVDEVLENSEKVETKEGDPCLLNSSLLRIEKMIKRMPEPTSLPDQRHNGVCDNALVSFMDLANEINIETEQELSIAEAKEKNDICQSSEVFETTNCWSQFFGEKEISNSTLENLEKVFEDSSMYLNDENQDDDMELKIEDEEEDIIPEALVQQTYLNNSMELIKEMPSTMDAFEDLLMDDMDPTDEIIDVEEITKANALQQLNCDPVSNEANSVKNASKLPKIISNQIITNDQIPPALLKALKNKSTIQQFCNENNENNTNHGTEYISENNNKINLKPIKNKTETVNMDIVKNNIEINVVHTEQYSVQNCVEDNLECTRETKSKNNVKTSVVSNSTISVKETAKSCESINNEVPQKTCIKSNDVSNSNSADNFRLTRSNSKLCRKSNEISTPNQNLSKLEHFVETKIKTLSENTFPKNFNNKKMIGHKRKKNTNNHYASKFYKTIGVNESRQKNPKVKVWKLLNDLKYGVKVVIERIDVMNTSS